VAYEAFICRHSVGDPSCITDKILGTNIDAQPGPSGAWSRATSASNKCAVRLSMPKDRTLAPSEVIRVARQPSCQGRFFSWPQISNVGLIIRFRIQYSARNRAILMR
jgi:hypothetical protein